MTSQVKTDIKIRTCQFFSGSERLWKDYISPVDKKVVKSQKKDLIKTKMVRYKVKRIFRW